MDSGLEQYFSMGAMLFPRKHVAMSRDTADCQTGKSGGVTDISCVEARVTTEYPTMNRTDTHNHKKSSIQSVNSSEVEKSWIKSWKSLVSDKFS